MTNAPTTRETADHAELAACPFCGGEAKSETLGHGKSARTGVKCADVDCPGSMRLVGPDEDGVAFWNRRPREAALLSEIAALRGEVDVLEVEKIGLRAAIFGSHNYDPSLRHGNFIEMARQTEEGRKGALSRATQAERQRDKLRRELEFIKGFVTPDQGSSMTDIERVIFARISRVFRPSAGSAGPLPSAPSQAKEAD